MAKIRFRSAEANKPIFETCLLPQAPTGVVERSAAMTAAEPRRKAKGDASIQAKRTGTSFSIRLTFCQAL